MKRKRIYSAYDKEYQSSKKRTDIRVKQNAARSLFMKKLKEKHGEAKAKQMMKGKDVDHIKPLNKWWTNKMGNLRLISVYKNRSRK